MAIIAFVSPKGSPGVTTTALACTLSWHSRVVLAECDPAGGSLMAGYLGGALEGPRGIGELAVSELRDGRLEQEFWGQLVDLDAPKRQRLLLPGLANPGQAGSLTPLWGRFADFFSRLEHENPGFDVLADCGRLHVANPPWPILRAASAVMVVTSARLPDLSNAAATIEAISRDLRDNGVPPGTVRLVVVGGGHGKGEISRALGVPVAAHLPIDRQTAQVLSYGGTVRGRRPLMRAAAALEMPVRSMVDRRRARATWNTMAPPMPPVPQHMPPPPPIPQHMPPVAQHMTAVPQQTAQMPAPPQQSQHVPPAPPISQQPAPQQSLHMPLAPSAAHQGQHLPPLVPQQPQRPVSAPPQATHQTQHLPQQQQRPVSVPPRATQQAQNLPEQAQRPVSAPPQATHQAQDLPQTAQRPVSAPPHVPHQAQHLPPPAPPASNGPITEELPRAV